MPELNIEQFQDRLDTINEALEKENFDLASFLIDDLIYILGKCKEKIENWKKLKGGQNDR